MMDVRLGDIVLYPRTGPLAATLVVPMRLLDPDVWVRQNYALWGRFWHMAFIRGWDPRFNEWVIRSIEGAGAKDRLLSEAPSGIRIVHYLDTPPAQHTVDDYCASHPGHGYDAIGYLWCALSRLSRGVFPAIEDKHFYCWEDVATFCECMGQPWMPYGEMPYLPVFMKGVSNG